MNTRMNVFEEKFGLMRAMSSLAGHLAKSTIEQSLLQLVYFRVSQINGCAFCLDMHSKDLRAEGGTEQRLYGISAWRETPFYSKRERAALAWAESLTEIANAGVSDEIYNQAREEFSEGELMDLTLGVVAINGYNRINVAFRTEAGNYQPGKFKVQQN